MSQIFDVAVEPSTTGLALGTSSRTWDCYFRYILQAQKVVFQAISQPSLSTPNTGVIYYDASTGFVKSENGGSYVSLGGGSPPFLDSNPLVKNFPDTTKQIIFSAASIATSTTRTITVPDTNLTMAGINIAQQWIASQDFANFSVYSTTHGGYVGGAGSGGQTATWFSSCAMVTGNFENVRICQAANNFTPYWKWALFNANTLYLYDNNNVVRVGLDSNAGEFVFASRVVADADNTRDLGRSNDRWSTIYAYNLNVTGSTTGTFKPATGSTDDLGSSAKTYGNVYTDQLLSPKVTVANTLFNANWYWTQVGGSGAVGLFDTGAVQRVLFTTTNTAQFTCDVMASVDATRSLGVTGTRWLNVWSNAYTLGTNGGGSAYMDIFTGTAPALSAAGSARMYYDGTNIKVSKNGGAYAVLI